jgi:hypothetical protein
MSETYLLCRPLGGFNDSLCEIEKCWRYAETRGRRLIVDSSRSGLHDDFWNYFVIRGNEDTVLQQGLDDAILNGMEVVPKMIEGRIDTYRTRYSDSARYYVEENSGEPVSFNFDLDYRESLLVHEQSWVGAFVSTNCLSRLRFTDWVRKEIERRLEGHDLENYIGIHVRHTDYKTNYKAFFSAIRERVSNKTLLLCADNVEVFRYANNFFRKNKVVRLSSFDDGEGKPLHAVKSKNQFEVNVELLTDLIALARTKTLISTNVTQINRPSGYSLLALSLKKYPQVVKGLMSR